MKENYCEKKIKINDSRIVGFSFVFHYFISLTVGILLFFCACHTDVIVNDEFEVRI